ncbi:hypothetical protein AVEN_268600-1 [Araneus ventricosus]|uniref:Uncharacterized protein n=1 Tax=Araneus ventricosus TaxID=182803 RepID=A0A4Y2GWY8_ARAVE|nr:hypothetical protein AVEN_268600-1 [Araneus ventricosus]
MTRTAPELAPPPQTSTPNQREDVRPTTTDLTYNRPTHSADKQWNRVSNLKPSGPELETLPLGQIPLKGHLKYGDENLPYE